jgi:hypothetical protein
VVPLKRIATLPNGVERAIAAFSRISDGGLIAVVSARGQLHRELIATLADAASPSHRLSLSLLCHERPVDLLWARSGQPVRARGWLSVFLIAQ